MGETLQCMAVKQRKLMTRNDPMACDSVGGCVGASSIIVIVGRGEPVWSPHMALHCMRKRRCREGEWGVGRTLVRVVKDSEPNPLLITGPSNSDVSEERKN